MTKLDSIVQRLNIAYVPPIKDDDDFISTVNAIIYMLEHHPDRQNLVSIKECKDLIEETKSRHS